MSASTTGCYCLAAVAVCSFVTLCGATGRLCASKGRLALKALKVTAKPNITKKSLIQNAQKTLYNH